MMKFSPGLIIHPFQLSCGLDRHPVSPCYFLVRLLKELKGDESSLANQMPFAVWVVRHLFFGLHKDDLVFGLGDNSQLISLSHFDWALAATLATLATLQIRQKQSKATKAKENLPG